MELLLVPLLVLPALGAAIIAWFKPVSLVFFLAGVSALALSGGSAGVAMLGAGLILCGYAHAVLTVK